MEDWHQSRAVLVLTETGCLLLILTWEIHSITMDQMVSMLSLPTRKPSTKPQKQQHWRSEEMLSLSGTRWLWDVSPFNTCLCYLWGREGAKSLTLSDVCKMRTEWHTSSNYPKSFIPFNFSEHIEDLAPLRQMRALEHIEDLAPLRQMRALHLQLGAGRGKSKE